MELYVIAGGQVDSLNRWQQDLNSQWLPLYENGKKVDFKSGKLTHRRLLVSPIQLYKICFPKEEKDRVLEMICPTSYIEQRYSFLAKIKNFISRALGLKKVDYPQKVNPFLQPNQVDKAVFVLPLGIKEDEIHNGVEQI